MSKLLYQVYNVSRAHVYTTLLRTPDREWTVREVAETVSARAELSRDTVRSNLYLLLADHVMDLVLVKSAMTLKFTEHGANRLQAVVRKWQRSGWWIPT